MAGRIKTYRDLDIWKAGIRLVKNIYQLTGKLPNHELYGLVSQMRRSAVSIPSNVAEGFRRFTIKSTSNSYTCHWEVAQNLRRR